MKKLVKLSLIFIAILIVIFGYLPYLYHPKKSKSVETIDFSKYSAHEKISLLEDPHVSGQVRLELIRNAKETIDISYHTFSEGVYSSMFVYELLNAAERGVKIRFLNDGIIGGFPTKARKTANTLAYEENITIGLYEPINLNPYTWHNRLHDKYLLVDGKYLITGGRNISDKTFMPDGFKFKKVFDRDIVIIGEKDEGVIKELSDYIETLWDQDYIKILKGKENKKHREKLIKEGIKNTAEHTELSAKPGDLRFFSPDAITLVTNPLGHGSKDPVIWDTLYSLMQQTDGDIILQSPYTILYDEQIDELKALNRDIVLMTNSLKSSPNIPAYPHYLRQRHQIEDIATIYEYAGSGSVHTKSFIIGDDISVIASFNLDPRSLNLDSESAYVIKSKEFNKYLREIHSKWQTQSIERSDGEVIYPDCYRNTPITFIKSVVFRVLSIIFIPLMPVV